MNRRVWLIFILLTSTVFADVCNNANAPLCPQGGARILDDRYPVRAFVISDVAYDGQFSSGTRLPVRAIVESMRAYNFNTASMPFIIYPGEDEYYAELRTALRAELIRQGKSESEADTLMESRLRHARGTSYTWQQDYQTFEFDPASGQPRARYLQIYNSRINGSSLPESLEPTVQAIGNNLVCGVTTGLQVQSSIIRLPESERSQYKASGEFGGNIEGLPGGLCLIGNNVTDDYAAEVCGGAGNVVRADVSWLEVGHVDEIFKVVPDHRPGVPAECAFKLLAADTDLGYSLLEGAGQTRTLVNIDHQELLDAVAEGPPPGLAMSELYRLSFVASPSTKVLCRAAQGVNAPASPAEDSGARTNRVSLPSFFPKAWAASLWSMSADQAAFRCVRNINDVRGSDLLSAVNAIPGFRDYNRLIQDSLTRSKAEMYRKILERLPQCRSHFPDVDSMFTKVPNIFTPMNPDAATSQITEVDGQKQLVRSQQGGLSIFPNPSNAVLMNRTLILPGPLPPTYREYLDREIGTLGMQRSYLDTWFYAHAGQGNIHCATQTVPYCRPNP